MYDGNATTPASQLSIIIHCSSGKENIKAFALLRKIHVQLVLHVKRDLHY